MNVELTPVLLLKKRKMLPNTPPIMLLNGVPSPTWYLLLIKSSFRTNAIVPCLKPAMLTGVLTCKKATDMKLIVIVYSLLLD